MVRRQLAPKVRRERGDLTEVFPPVVVEGAVELAGAESGMVRSQKLLYFLNFQPNEERHALSLAPVISDPGESWDSHASGEPPIVDQRALVLGQQLLQRCQWCGL